MHDLDEDDIRSLLSPLASVAPALQDTQRVLESARRSVAHRRILRLSITAGIAAMIGAMVVTASLIFAPGSASAADALAQAAVASVRFQGWIHLRTQSPGEKDFEIEHINNQNGSFALEVHSDGILHVEMYVPDQLEALEYDGGNHELKIGPITEEFANGWKKTTADFPLTIAACLAEVPGIKVKQTVDGKLLRFDLTFPPDDQAKASQQNRTPYPTAAVVWAEPNTKLIEKGTTTANGKTVTVDITYGDPVIRDIFDLGVPKAAKIVDVRPVRDIAAFEKQLKAHFKEGFGDYAACCVRVATYRTNGQAPIQDQEMEIYGALGAGWVADIFRGDENPELAVLPRWPSPQLDTAIASLQKKTPRVFFTSDGETAWRDYASGGSGARSTKVTKQGDADLEYLKGMFTLPGLLWPVNRLALFGTDGKVEQISDPARPGLFGLKLDRLYFMNAPDDSRLVETYWFDPAKDDLAVECTEIYTTIATGKIAQQSHRACSDFKQTENGRWYPCRMNSRSIQNFSGGGAQEESCDWYLQVSTTKKLGPEWFTHPAARANTKP